MTSAAQEVMLVRHPQTVANAEGRYMGRGDSPLTPEGELQVRWLTRVVAGWEPEAAYTSPIGRARNAARAITPANVALEVADDLQEIDFGRAEGYTFAELGELGIRLDYTSGGPIAPDGEPADAFRARVARVAAAIEADGRRLLVVTHGGLLRHLVTQWLDLPFMSAWRLGVPNAAVAVVRLTGSTGVLEALTPPPEDPTHRAPRLRRPWLHQEPPE